MSRQHSIFNYPLKVWLFTVIGAPVLLFISTIEKSSTGFAGFSNSISFILPLIIIGGIVSLPAFFIYRRLYRIVIQLQVHIFFRKTLLLFISIFLITATFHITIGFNPYELRLALYFLPNNYYIAVFVFTYGFAVKPDKAVEINKMQQ